MTAETLKRTAQMDALHDFVQAVTLEIITTVNMQWGQQNAPEPNPHAIVLYLDDETPFGSEVSVDDSDNEQYAEFITAILRLEIIGSEYRIIEKALRKAKSRLDLIELHLLSAGVAWRGQLGGRTDLTGVVGTHKEGRSEVSFQVAWRVVDTRAVANALLVRANYRIDGDFGTVVDIDISPP